MLLKARSRLKLLKNQLVHCKELQANGQCEFALFPRSGLKMLCLSVVLSLDSHLCSVPPKM